MRRAEQRGASALEFAIIAPLLFLVIFGIIDLGLLLGSSSSLSNAAREGARLGAVDLDEAKVEAMVRDAAGNLDQSRLKVKITCRRSGGGSCSGGLSGAEPGDRITVELTYDHELATPVFKIGGKDSMKLTAESQMRVE